MGSPGSAGEPYWLSITPYDRPSRFSPETQAPPTVPTKRSVWVESATPSGPRSMPGCSAARAAETA